MFDFYEIFKKNYYRNKGQRLLLRGHPEKAFPYLEKALFMEYNSFNLYNISLVLLSMQQYEEAERYLIITVNEEPGNAMAVLTLSEIYMHRRDWDKSAELLCKLSEYYPSNKNYRKYYERVSDPIARESYIKAKELLNQARTYIETNKFSQAINALLEAEKLDPENPYIQSNLGSYFLRIKNDPKTALKYFNKAYELSPENLNFKKNLEVARNQAANSK